MEDILGKYTKNQLDEMLKNIKEKAYKDIDIENMELKEFLKLIHEKLDLKFCGDKIEKLELNKEEYNKGLIKCNFPGLNKLINDNNNINGEGCYCYINPEDREKYDNDSYKGIIKGILLNDVIEYYGILFWGTEIEIKCNGNQRPIVSRNWFAKNVLKIN